MRCGQQCKRICIVMPTLGCGAHTRTAVHTPGLQFTHWVVVHTLCCMHTLGCGAHTRLWCTRWAAVHTAGGLRCKHWVVHTLGCGAHTGLRCTQLVGCGARSWQFAVHPWLCGSCSPPGPARSAHATPAAPRSQPRAGRRLRHAPRCVRLAYAAAATGPAGERLPPAAGTGHRRRALRRAAGARVPAVAAPPPAPPPGLRTRRARHSRGGPGMRFPQGCPCSAGPLLRPAAGGP